MADSDVQVPTAPAGSQPRPNPAERGKADSPDGIEPVEEALRHYHSTEDPGSDSSMTKVVHNAKAATEKEQKMSLLEGIRLYPKAVCWSVLISTCIAMEGYDISLVNNFYGFDQFNRKYGQLQADGSYQVSAQLIGVGVIKGMLNRTDQWAYRIPYGLQWMWPLPLFLGIFFAPESPWWLIRKGRTDDAKRALERLTSKNRETDFNADETIAMMVHTNALEAKITNGASYMDCFKGTDLRRTEIVCAAWAIQNLAGNSFSNFSTYFLEQAGVSHSDSYSFAMGQYAINMVGTFGAWGLMALGVGRRSLIVIPWSRPAAHHEQASMATGSLMLVWALIYQLTVGTVTYSLVAEVSTRRLQIKTVVLGRALYIIVAIVCGVLTPYMVNPTAWNWQNYAGFFWGGSCFLCIIYAYFRIPEPSGRSFAELDMLFERGVSARKFATTPVDVFDETVEGRVIQDYRAEKVAVADISEAEKGANPG
ncbi:hypothetical protein N7470_001667 [Penicillium chermesinum]|nr:hypothetical protein N7470_001667 [Penicillium chermesinum]